LKHRELPLQALSLALHQPATAFKACRSFSLLARRTGRIAWPRNDQWGWMLARPLMIISAARRGRNARSLPRPWHRDRPQPQEGARDIWGQPPTPDYLRQRD
jgi:hypothetical protein